MYQVTLEESITGIYKAIFNNLPWEDALDLKLTQRERRDIYLPVAVELAQQGMDYYEIAAELGYNADTIWRWLKKGVGIDARKHRDTKAKN